MWLIGAMACLLAAQWVQLSVSAGDGWPHNALQHHWLMPNSCHFRDCKALMITSLTHVSGAIASVQTLTLMGMGTRKSCPLISGIYLIVKLPSHWRCTFVRPFVYLLPETDGDGSLLCRPFRPQQLEAAWSEISTSHRCSGAMCIRDVYVL